MLSLYMVCSFYREFHSGSASSSTSPLFEFVVLTDGESYDPHLFSRTRTFHSQMFFSGSTTTGSSYVTRGSAVEFRLVFGLFVPDEWFPKHREDLVVGDRCRHPQFRLEPDGHCPLVPRMLNWSAFRLRISCRHRSMEDPVGGCV